MRHATPRQTSSRRRSADAGSGTPNSEPATEPVEPLPPRYRDPYHDIYTSQPELRPQRRPSLLNPFRLVQGITNAMIGAAVILGLAAGIGFWRTGDRFLEGARIMFTAEAPEPEVDVRSIVVQQLRGASELTTAIFAMEAVVPTRSDRTLAGYVIGSTQLLYVAYGEVRAGVDLSQITVTDVQLDGETAIQVTLPPPQILDSKLDLSRSNVYDYNRGFLGLGPDTAPNLQELAQQEALTKIEAAACAEGLLDEANRRAEMAVGKLLSTAGFETVQIVPQSPNGACADLANSDTVIPGSE
ncbi:DUF4230 domain-containing protein [Nodosilinea sp. P-1105]|uniref:DUF4230 domain-containing protein n=1 Tax=Nodosilinea sp. P-1105 TaxID=2546229 RepID=UPI001F0DA892|nr:DUF4230 domain-containing protein [Nodosilinea sp. P-1105]